MLMLPVTAVTAADAAAEAVSRYAVAKKNAAKDAVGNAATNAVAAADAVAGSDDILVFEGASVPILEVRRWPAALWHVPSNGNSG